MRSNGLDDVRQTRDNCPYKVTKSVNLNQATPWNITAELPEALFIKHAGWAPDMSDLGIGVFAARPFKKGEEIGSALARVAPCDSTASVETPVGIREIRCDIHFFDLPEDDSGSDDNLAVFPSWMVFINHPDVEGDVGLAAGANVEWATSNCDHPSGAPLWRLFASKDIAPQAELRLVYDDSSSAMKPKRAMKKMKKGLPPKKAPIGTMRKGMKAMKRR